MPCAKCATNEIIELLKNGDQDAMSQLYDIYSPRVYGIISHLVPKPAVDELTVKSFVAISNQIHQYKSSQSFFSWMYAIVMKEILLWHEQYTEQLPL